MSRVLHSESDMIWPVSGLNRVCVCGGGAKGAEVYGVMFSLLQSELIYFGSYGEGKLMKYSRPNSVTVLFLAS
jgi:hypothetical protein